MITPRSTTVYKPKNYNYGNQTKPVKKKEGGSVRKSHTPVSEKDWRDSNNYREQYFERNHGIGGYGYICSQCWKPMFVKSKIQVDHIIPPSRFARNKKIKAKVKGEEDKWVKTSMMSRFLNSSFNCAAICPSCNAKKSNTMDKRIIYGYIMKTLEVTYGLSQVALSIPFMAVAGVMWGTRKAIVGLLSIRGGHNSKRRTRR